MTSAASKSIEATRLPKPPALLARTSIRSDDGSRPVSKRPTIGALSSSRARTFALSCGARQPQKQPCRPGEIYCLPCRAPKRPALSMTEYIPRTNSRGMLRGICPTCERLIYRAVNLASVDQMRGDLEVSY
jgi:hypothetical protein